ncbi:hypothetical protein GCM10010389_20890 [Streptomyces echinoruber]|uniref:Uncharacterized protein n=1 Tax=Streptomyces echinoruber TaxID=68898 RepID=A0A918R2U5_9ACTN|nr:hypothetical protein GCM10010389_20890 [Streptomyces echinoruber]
MGEVHRGHAALAEQVAQLVAPTGERLPRVLPLRAVVAHSRVPRGLSDAADCSVIRCFPVHSRPSLPEGTDTSSAVPVP